MAVSNANNAPYSFTVTPGEVGGNALTVGYDAATSIGSSTRDSLTQFRLLSLITEDTGADELVLTVGGNAVATFLFSIKVDAVTYLLSDATRAYNSTTNVTTFTWDSAVTLMVDAVASVVEVVNIEIVVPVRQRDIYSSAPKSRDEPSIFWAELTPSDSVILPIKYRFLYIGVGGNVEVKDQNGVAASFIGVPAGTMLPVRATYLMATGTTATNIVGME